MNLIAVDQLEAEFDRLVKALLQQLQSEETLKLVLQAEQSQFIRCNTGKVRQIGCIGDGELTLTLMRPQRSCDRSIPFTGNWELDWPQAQTALSELQQELPDLPEDPYLVLPQGDATSREWHSGELLPTETAVEALLAPASELTGIYASGTMVRAYADSIGQRHWFATDAFALDYSLFTSDGQAVKETFAGNRWDQAAYVAKLAQSQYQLQQMAQSPKQLPRGQYRTYLAPAAVAELMSMFSWGSFSEAALQRGGSALGVLQREEKQLSPAFSLTENFKSGLVPRFNESGEIAPIELPLIVAGQLKNTLISARTAKEYGKTANGAANGEYLRSPEVAAGELATDQILTALDTGLYLSNLHYLNWSDRPTGRITGMTRYACFWVEQGKIVAPIANLRFDESLYRFLGDQLIDLTQVQEFIPEIGTYNHRSLGGIRVPGMLVQDFTYTL